MARTRSQRAAANETVPEEVYSPPLARAVRTVPEPEPETTEEAVRVERRSGPIPSPPDADEPMDAGRETLVLPRPVRSAHARVSASVRAVDASGRKLRLSQHEQAGASRVLQGIMQENK
jgi:hypothetical protein